MCVSSGCKNQGTDPKPEPGFFQLLKVSADGVVLNSNSVTEEISPEVTISISFSAAVDTAIAKSAIQLTEAEDNPVDLSFSFHESETVIHCSPIQPLDYKTEYILTLGADLKSEDGAEFPGLSYQIITENGTIRLEQAMVNDLVLSQSTKQINIPYNSASVSLQFSEALDAASYQNYIQVIPSTPLNYSLSNDGKTVEVIPQNPLDYYSTYTVIVSSGLTAAAGFEFSGYSAAFQTGLDSTYKFPEISDEELLTKIQESTFQYFWDFGHPVSGLARERNSSGDIVTIGGSGFGLMAILVGVERGFITRAEGIARLQKIVSFLGNEADRFHGVWPHWLNGVTGDVVAFSTKDNGADLVETAFMAQGLIAVRQYLNGGDTDEASLKEDINTLLNEIEWDWFTRDGQDVLYWHWSPNYGWEMNMQIKGYNEALIVYVLAASSTTHSIDADVYHKGWASSGSIVNGNEYYGIELPVGYGYGGPLFFAHYSFLGLDPRNLSDTYANYWTQNRSHSLIHQAYSEANPRNFVGYSADSWGLTASDEPNGYSAHEPNNDNGTITPTGAVSSLPYTPEESMAAIRHFYYVLGDKLWGEYGFYDAFNPTQSWWADSYLAIDQGPIVVMIENHRSALIWDLFMSAPEVQSGLDKLGFTISE